VHRIEAELMIPGRGEPVRDGAVVLDGSTISYAGPAADPLAGIGVLAQPAHVTGVWRAGRRVKG
jgi:hypothetical protein